MLNISIPQTNTARLRFTTEARSLVSKVIRFGTEGAVSHVEAVTSLGTIIASHISSGVAAFSLDYNKAATLQIVVDLPMGAVMFKTWEQFLYARVGWPYDSPAIVGLATHFDEHEVGALICSALQVDALRHCGWFRVPLSQRYHEISPVVLLLMMQADPRSIIYPPESA